MNLSLKLLKNRPADPRVKSAVETAEIRHLWNGADYRYILQMDLRLGWSEGVMMMEKVNQERKKGEMATNLSLAQERKIHLSPFPP
jgi:hypothetical protein